MRKLPIAFLLICLWLCLAARVLAEGEDALLDPDEAFEMASAVEKGDTATFSWSIAEGYYLYKHKFKFASKTPGIELDAPQFPQGEAKQDKFLGHVEIYHRSVAVALPLRRRDPGIRQATVEVVFQGCAESRVCYLPIRKTVSFELGEAGGIASAPAAPLDDGLGEFADMLKGRSLGLILSSFFGFGLLLAFTPCVFPMIPIVSGIVIGDASSLSARRAFGLSLSYVLGSAFTYTALGVMAGLFGEYFQAFFQQPAVLIAASAVFVLLALAMFGLFDFQMPSFLQTRFSLLSARQRRGSWLGAAAMGLFSALTIGPCVTAPLAGVLLYIGKSGDALLGGLALFALGIGMGVPMLLIGTSAGRWMPRAGAWLHITKMIIGTGLLAVSLWLLGRILMPKAMQFLWGMLLIVPLAYLGWKRLWRAVGSICALYGLLLLIGFATRTQRNYLELLCTAAVACQAEALPFQRIESAAGLDHRLDDAQQQGRWLMLDFHADWCVSCLEMQNLTFTEPRVRAALAQVALVQADVTEGEAEARALLKRFDLVGPPAILFFGPDRTERKSFRLIGYSDSEAFLRHLARLGVAAYVPAGSR